MSLERKKENSKKKKGEKEDIKGDHICVCAWPPDNSCIDGKKKKEKHK